MELNAAAAASLSSAGEREPPLRPVFLTPKAACALTGLGMTTIYKLIADGTLQSVVIGRSRRILYASIEALGQAAK